MKQRGQVQRGTAAIELVLVLLTGIVLLQGLLLFGRLTWHLVAMQKAVGSAARIVSAQPVGRLTGTGASLRMNTFGDAHVQDAMLAAGVDMLPPAEMTEVQCGTNACYLTTFTSVRVTTQLAFADTVFGDATAGWITEPLGNIIMSSTINYVP